MSKSVNLSEYIHPKMDILFLALNAPEVSNSNAHWFSRNLSFWNLLYDAGIINSRIYNPLEGDIKVFGTNTFNWNNMTIGVTDLNREQVETQSNKVNTTKVQVDKVLGILDDTDTQKLCIMHSKAAKEFAKHGIIKSNNSYGKIGQYKGTEIFNVPFHNASVPNKASYYKMLLTNTVITQGQKAVKEIPEIQIIKKAQPLNSSNVFYLPDGMNSITESDIKAGTIRITIAAKEYFKREAVKLHIEINGQIFCARYIIREGRSDLLRIGKQALNLLGVKPGGRLKFTKFDALRFKIEKS